MNAIDSADAALWIMTGLQRYLNEPEFAFLPAAPADASVCHLSLFQALHRQRVAAQTTVIRLTG